MKLNIVNKRITAGIFKIRKPGENIKFGLGTLALMSVCFMLLVTSAFTQINYNFNLPLSDTNSVFNFEYIPQIPVVILIAALLGIKWGVLTVLLYVLVGLSPIYPIFGLGGGLSYMLQYNFGYIASFVFAAYFCAKELRHKKSIISGILAALYGVLIVHISGIIFMTIVALIQHDSVSFISDFIYYQSLSKILYDVLFSLIAILAAKIARKFTWIITG